MRILGLIPARGGSKGVPGKNIKKLGGKPLICYTIDEALNCNSIVKLVVSTDDESIASVGRMAGAFVPFLRPMNLAKDTSPTIDTVIHAIEYYEKQGEVFDAVCLLQPTCPFRTSADISSAISLFTQSKADSLISVRAVPHSYNPHWVFEIKKGSPFLEIATGEKEIISRRQDLPKAFHRDGSIYITRTDVLKNKRSLYGDNIAYYESTHTTYVNIDTPEDWKEAERLLQNS